MFKLDGDIFVGVIELWAGCFRMFNEAVSKLSLNVAKLSWTTCDFHIDVPFRRCLFLQHKVQDLDSELYLKMLQVATLPR
jgi:hypothetical protein